MVLRETPGGLPDRRAETFDKSPLSKRARANRTRPAPRSKPDSTNTLERMRILAELGPGFLHDIRNLLAVAQAQQ
jgi:hypothetical protein